MATNGLKKKLLLVCVIILLLALIAVVGVVIWLKVSAPEKVCLTRKCVEAANEVFDKIDESVEPCENFYEFACGNYMKNAHILDTETSTAVFKDIDRKLGLKIKKIVTNEKTTNNSAYSKIKNLYQLCKDQINTNETNRKIFQKIDSYFQIKSLKDWDDLYELLGKIGSYSRPFSDDYITTNFPTLNIQANLTNSAQQVLSVGDPSLPFSHTYFLNNGSRYEKFRGLLKTLVISYLDLINEDMEMGWTRSKIENFQVQIMKNWMFIASNTMPRVLRRDYSEEINVKTLGDLKKISQRFDWIRYVNKYLNSNVSENFLVNVENEAYLVKIRDLNDNFNFETEKAQILLGMAYSATKFLRPAYMKVKDNFFKEINGKSIDKGTWENCQYFPSMFNRRLAKEYLNMYFDQESRYEASNMIKYIKTAFKDQIMASTWMTAEVKRVAIEKAVAMEEYIGYTDDYLNETWVNMDLAEGNNSQNNIVDIMHNMAIYQGKERIKKLYETEKKPPFFSPAQVNGFYSGSDNQILFPAGILQQPLFDKNYPKYVNYGSIGAVIGHEISHGFDDRGRQRDKNGNVKTWWDQESINRYTERAACYVEQYSQYRAPDEDKTPLDGKATLGENLADNAGVKQAFEAYKMWVRENGPEPKLPSLKYTPEQIFFLKYGQTWCAVIREKGWKGYIINAAHSPYMFRAIGVLRNSKEFAKAFNCKLNSKMNPAKKCQLW